MWYLGLPGDPFLGHNCLCVCLFLWYAFLSFSFCLQFRSNLGFLVWHYGFPSAEATQIQRANVHMHLEFNVGSEVAVVITSDAGN